MIGIYQDLPNNCFAACLASILELPLNQVPNFVVEHGESWLLELLTWLRPMNLAVAYLEFNPSLPLPGGYAILTVQGGPTPEENHALVAFDGKVVWNPAKHSKAWFAFGTELYWTVFTVLDPTKPIVRTVIPKQL